MITTLLILSVIEALRRTPARVRRLMFAALVVTALSSGCAAPSVSSRASDDPGPPIMKKDRHDFWFKDAPEHLVPEKVTGGIMP